MGFATAAVVAGAGASMFGAMGSSRAAKAQNAAQQAQIEAEQRAEALRRQQMELESRRRLRETVRNQQRARAQALAASTNQGASQGSGLQGGYGQIAGDAGNQLLATGQNLEIGRGIFDANAANSAARMQYASASTDMATYKGISSLGGTLMSLSGTMGNIFGGYNPTSMSTYRWGDNNVPLYGRRY